MYSHHAEMIGRKFPIEEGLRTALAGSSHISTLDSDENEFETTRWERLIETYGSCSAAVAPSTGSARN